MKQTFENLINQLKDKVIESSSELNQLTENATSTDRETLFAVDQLSRCLSYLSLCELTHRNAIKTIEKLKQKQTKLIK